MCALVTGRIVRPDGCAAPGWLEIDGERIVAAGEGPAAGEAVHADLIAPALFDLQVNGVCGVEALAGGDALDAIDRALAARGVLRWLAAIPTVDDGVAVAALDAIAERAADPAHGLAGAHLEGPFLSPAHPGVHRPELLRDPAAGVPAHYGHEAVRVVTLAPELPGALELVARLRRSGVAVALGHSGADAHTATAALAAGAQLVTHTFNAMAPLHHRAPGLAGVALTDPRALPCVIADGLHLDPLTLRLVRKAAGRRAILVSDASAAAAAPPGEYALAGTPIRRDEAGAVRDADGRLAGSAILLDEAVRNWVDLAGAPAAEALAAASWRPALASGRPLDLRPGARADLVLAAEEGRIERVMRGGRWL